MIQRAIHPTNVHFLAISFRFNETVESRPSRDVPSSNGRSYYRHYKYMVTRHERGSVCVISTTALVRFASGLPARYRSIIARRNAKKAGKGRRKKARVPLTRVWVLSTRCTLHDLASHARITGWEERCAGASGLRMCVCASRKRVRGHARASFSFLSRGIRQELLPLA